MPEATSPHLDGTIGNATIGVAFSTFLFGIETLQTFNYYRDFPKDSKKLKVLVSMIWIIELTQTMLTWHAPQHLASPPFSLILVVLFSAMINFLVQTFFALRVQALSKAWAIPVLVCVLNLLRFMANVGIFAQLVKRPEFSLLETSLHWLFTTGCAIGPVVDILTATSLCIFLWRYKSSNFEQISGALQLIFTVFANSMLSSLNGRQHLRRSKPQGNLDGGSHFLAFDSATPSNNVDTLYVLDDEVPWLKQQKAEAGPNVRRTSMYGNIPMIAEK
ncbi:hypothetical protein B0H15DRAFT_805110 [Mycena belliarum]|uniref:Transmembrane protein n=1 Tax=Mycena belliarum TaxID=1033014 RepID=A0AAD6TUB7_9AGAR|nr:hypothetical protein B0H15DRAFT_805110 [Mycena belliae]